MSAKYETRVGPNGVRRLVRVDAEGAAQEIPISAPAPKAETPPAAEPGDLEDIRRRARDMVADARARLRLLKPVAHPPQPDAVPGLLPSHVARARVLAKITQRDLARAWRIPRSAVAEAERGVRPIPPVIALWARRVLHASGEWTESAQL